LQTVIWSEFPIVARSEPVGLGAGVLAEKSLVCECAQQPMQRSDRQSGPIHQIGNAGGFGGAGDSIYDRYRFMQDSGARYFQLGFHRDSAANYFEHSGGTRRAAIQILRRRD
jgi:hypothetical protein